MLIVSLVSGALTGLAANKLGSTKTYFHDNDHFTCCEIEHEEKAK